MRSAQTPCDRCLRRIAVHVAGTAAVRELVDGVGGALERLRVR